MSKSEENQSTVARSAVTARASLPDYDVFESIGSGGMARVFRAMHKPLEREVALKILLPEFSSDASFAERFLREARIAARLVHPHIVQIYDVDQHENDLYLAMELVKDGDLSQKIKQGLTAKVLLKVIEELCEALDFAHAEGYIHRDIKPPNILFRSDGSVVLSDFGIARSMRGDAQLTQAGMILGTPTYMSPEQAEGKELGGVSDLYSVGILIFEMVTGLPPYRSSSAIDVLHQHLSAPLPKLPGALPNLQNFFNVALAKQPENRFKTGRAMAEALREAIENEDDLPGIRRQFTAMHTAVSSGAGQSEDVTKAHSDIVKPKASRARPGASVERAQAEKTRKPAKRSRPTSAASVDVAPPKKNRAGQNHSSKSNGLSWFVGTFIIVITLAFMGAYLITRSDDDGAGRDVVKLAKFDEKYIVSMLDHAYKNYTSAITKKRALDGEIRRKMALGNTGDDDVDHIINATIKDYHADVGRLVELVVDDVYELALYYHQSPRYVDKTFVKKSELEGRRGDDDKSLWLERILHVLQRSPDEAGQRRQFITAELSLYQ